MPNLPPAPEWQFSLDDTSCTVLLGRTRVMTVITASLEAPYPDRPNEGSVRFNVEFSPMASPAFEAGKLGRDRAAWGQRRQRACTWTWHVHSYPHT